MRGVTKGHWAMTSMWGRKDATQQCQENVLLFIWTKGHVTSRDKHHGSLVNEYIWFLGWAERTMQGSTTHFPPKTSLSSLLGAEPRIKFRPPSSMSTPFGPNLCLLQVHFHALVSSDNIWTFWVSTYFWVAPPPTDTHTPCSCRVCLLCLCHYLPSYHHMLLFGPNVYPVTLDVTDLRPFTRHLPFDAAFWHIFHPQFCSPFYAFAQPTAHPPSRPQLAMFEEEENQIFLSCPPIRSSLD